MPYPPLVAWRKRIFNFGAATSLKSSPTCVRSMEIDGRNEFLRRRGSRYPPRNAHEMPVRGQRRSPWHVPSCFGVFAQTNRFWPRAPAQAKGASTPDEHGTLGPTEGYP
jgi:hypothetical protein